MKNELYKIWSRLGVGFNIRMTPVKNIDLEETIVRTCIEGRRDSRVLFGMRGWLLKHHDLVNCSRLIRLTKKSEHTAVLGAILESVINEIPRSGLQYVIKYCQRANVTEFVFHHVKDSKALSALNTKENLALWKKWNLISREMESMSGAIMDKSFIIKNNTNLAIRALFGPGLKAEILSFFLNHKEGNANKISQKICLSYEPVHSELDLFKKIGLINETKHGRSKVFAINRHFLLKVLKPLGV
ncbi:MAG: hypothetical protein HQM16_14310 [Deltaproteobacteria bacterium]|nr:hypothetical protein [Deltaproteobacteria bacterium]